MGQTMKIYFVECANENKSHGVLNDSERKRGVRLIFREKRKRLCTQDSSNSMEIVMGSTVYKMIHHNAGLTITVLQFLG